MSWAANHDGSIQKLIDVQGSLTVRLLMTPRQDLMTCAVQQTAQEVDHQNQYNFSFIPVADHTGRILGLYNAERWFREEAPSRPVDGDYQPLSEDMLIGADASIFDFIMTADEHPTQLVVSGSSVAGLISLSDLQQLPVRAALFALITSLEMAMAMVIEKQCGDASKWLGKISPDRQAKLTKEIAKAKAKDGFVSEITSTQFSDKATILTKEKLYHHGSRGKAEKAFKAIRDLRDAVAHANEYASTPDRAKSVCATVREIYALKTYLIGILES